MTEEERAERPDLYIAFVCAAGTDLSEIQSQLSAQLSVVKYNKFDVKVSSLIKEVLQIDGSDDEYARIKNLMAGGDSLRRNSEGNKGVASLIVSKLRSLRGEGDVPASRAYVIDSLKNPSEVDLLDKIYGRNFYTISVYSPKEERIENLKNKIAKSRHEPPADDHFDLAKNLVNEDEKGAEKSDQDVQGTFPLADFFINTKLDIKSQITRFIQLICNRCTGPTHGSRVGSQVGLNKSAGIMESVRVS